jgi:UDP-glucuronate 4-epimerase
MDLGAGLIWPCFNNGDLSRDFTYIDDIVEGVINTLLETPKNKTLYKLYNIGNNEPVKLMDFINAIEKNLNITAKKNLMPMQPGDVNRTWADINQFKNDFSNFNKTNINQGVSLFIKWYKNFYNVS